VLKLYKTTKTGRNADGNTGRLSVDKRHLYVSCADEWLQIDELQLAGKKRMDAAAFLNGTKDIENYFVR
jgi:methionyl-tRNA formyltransferase